MSNGINFKIFSDLLQISYFPLCSFLWRMIEILNWRNWANRWVCQFSFFLQTLYSAQIIVQKISRNTTTPRDNSEYPRGKLRNSENLFVKFDLQCIWGWTNSRRTTAHNEFFVTIRIMSHLREFETCFLVHGSDPTPKLTSQI